MLDGVHRLRKSNCLLQTLELPIGLHCDVSVFLYTQAGPCSSGYGWSLTGFIGSGMGPDSRVLVRKSRKQAQQYYRIYKVLAISSLNTVSCYARMNSRDKSAKQLHSCPHQIVFIWFIYLHLLQENIPVLQLVRETAAVMQEFTQSG